MFTKMDAIVANDCKTSFELFKIFQKRLQIMLINVLRSRFFAVFNSHEVIEAIIGLIVNSRPQLPVGNYSARNFFVQFKEFLLYWVLSFYDLKRSFGDLICLISVQF